MTKLLPAAGACLVVLSVVTVANFAAGAPAAPIAATASSADGVVLAPHRAFYDLKLSRSGGSRGITDVRGRILYDFSGSACEGYTLKFRQISDLNTGEGNDALSDLSSTTWEDGPAKKYRFASENKLNQKTGDKVDGHAERKADTIAVTLTKPQGKTFQLPVDVVFPTEHMRKIIAAARAGKKVIDVPVYDGSDNGEKLYSTLTVIGQAIAPDKQPDDAAAKSADMAGLTRWPVTVSYFDRAKEGEGEQTPAYAISFELYENGVSRALILNYTDFSISGELVSLDVKKAKPCK